MTAHHVVLGDPSHGVTRLALQLTPGRARTRLDALSSVCDAEVARATLPSVDEAPAVHLHLTDALLGPDPVRAFAALVAGRRAAITLHDVPQAAEGAARARRRESIYRELADAADLVLVSSDHERAGLERLGARVDHVLSLPIDGRLVAAVPEREPTVGVLGWIHPGKGHDVLAGVLGDLGRPATLVAIGGVVAGHEAYAAALQAQCARLGVGYRCCGYGTDDDLLREAALVAVPVCAHRHVSASGTIGSWLSAGRRPIVAVGGGPVPEAGDQPRPDGRRVPEATDRRRPAAGEGPVPDARPPRSGTHAGYAEEVARRLPGALAIVDDLGRAIEGALDDPASTVLAADVVVGPDTPEAARAQDAVLEAWARTPAIR